MRITTSHLRRAGRMTVPSPESLGISRPDRSLLSAISLGVRAIAGQRRRAARRAREPFERLGQLDLDQRVREIGEW